MRFAKITDAEILRLIKQMKADDSWLYTTGDVVILKVNEDEDDALPGFEVIRIAERRLYKPDGTIFYESVNENYAPTVS
jgi:hypothetical protein